MATILRGRGFTAEEMRQRFGHFQPEFELYVRNAPITRVEEPSKKYAVMKRDSYSAWETHEDAAQYGHLAFGFGDFLMQQLTDDNYEAVLAVFPEFKSLAEEARASCTASGSHSDMMDASYKSELA